MSKVKDVTVVKTQLCRASVPYLFIRSYPESYPRTDDYWLLIKVIDSSKNQLAPVASRNPPRLQQVFLHPPPPLPSLYVLLAVFLAVRIVEFNVHAHRHRQS